MPTSPRFVTFEVFEDNLDKYDGNTLLDKFYNWFKQSLICDCPLVTSPLHTPDNAKSHIHCIVDVTNTDKIRDFDYFTGYLKSLDFPRPEIVRNIYQMELYLTHDTVQSKLDNKQSFSADERATMRFYNDYALHVMTARHKAEQLSLLIAQISEYIEDYIYNNGVSDIFSISQELRKPEFYSSIDTNFNFDFVKAKARSEFKVHYRYYMSYADCCADMAERKKNQQIIAEQKQARDDLLSDVADTCKLLNSMIDTLPNNVARSCFYDMYTNDKEFRYKIKEIGGLSNVNFTEYLKGYVHYCGYKNIYPDKLAIILGYLQKYTDYLNIGLKF